MLSYIDEGNLWAFIWLTLILGGGAAYLSGKALASGWRSIWLVFIYMALLAAGIRFLHFALYEHKLSSYPLYLVTYYILLVFCLYGYRTRRVSQMVQQYPWKYERIGIFAWREKK